MKNNYLKIIILLMLSSIFVIKSFGQENYFKINGQYRSRTEFRNGYRTLVTDSSKSAFFTGQRARLIFDYKKDNIKFYSSIQDSRTWGDEEQKKDLAGLQVNELWLELGLNKSFSLKLGRQELAYDDHRLLGNLDWANLTISHDAAVLKYHDEQNKFSWHIGGAYNQVGEPLSGTTYSLKNYKALGFTWIKKEFDKKHSLSAMAVVNGMNSTIATSSKMKATYTFGPLYNYSFKGWKATLGAYYQGGKTDNNLKQNAFMINTYGEKKLKPISFGFGIDYLSGNSDNTKATESSNFNTLYATNHKFYGYMDYFLSIPTDTKQRGLVDMYARIGIYPHKQVSAFLDIHNFSLANENNLNTLAIKKQLGTETDLIIDYKPSPIIQLQFGYSLMFASNNMKLIKGGNPNDLNTWAYLMLKVSPTLLYNEFKK